MQKHKLHNQSHCPTSEITGQIARHCWQPLLFRLSSHTQYSPFDGFEIDSELDLNLRLLQSNPEGKLLYFCSMTACTHASILNEHNSSINHCVPKTTINRFSNNKPPNTLFHIKGETFYFTANPKFQS